MARFSGEYQETFHVEVPLEAARARFGSLERIAGTFANLERWEPVDEKTLQLYLKPKEGKGTAFRGRYRCRYELSPGDVLEWKTVGDGNNMWSDGRARFFAEGAGRTRIEWWGRVEMELEVPKLVSRVVAPLVSHEIRNGIARNVANVRRVLNSSSG